MFLKISFFHAIFLHIIILLLPFKVKVKIKICKETTFHKKYLEAFLFNGAKVKIILS